jgi:signal transduction histidine kinase
VSPDRTFSPADEARTVLRLLQVELVERRVTLRTLISGGGALRGDPARFGQIVQNLVSNAVDAYVGAPGVVEVRIVNESEWILVEVSDEGTGIAPEIRDRIFEHFFTTKGVGEGTGLGLALVHDLATEYFGGSVDFESEVGRGTRFMVRLPAASRKVVQ